jgi:hypothetical protein
MLLAPWAIQGLKAQDFQYVPTPPDASRWPPTPKPNSTYFLCRHFRPGSVRKLSAKELRELPKALESSGLDMNVIGQAIVRTVHGNCDYSKGDQWLPVKPNSECPPCTTLRAGPDSHLDVWVNRSNIRITADTTLQLQRMARASGPVRDSDTETTLDLKSGAIIGDVRNLSANSRYRITTPHGIAATRGAELLVAVLPQPHGEPSVTFSCITGYVICSADVNGKPAVKLLRTAECWTAGDKDIKPVPPAVLQAVLPVITPLPLSPNW